MLKEAEVTVRIRNNVMKSERLRCGMSQKQLGAVIGVGVGSIGHLETLRQHPKRDGVWLPAAVRVAEFFDMSPDEMFPIWLYELETPVATKELSREDVAILIATEDDPPMLADERAMLAEAVEELERQLSTLPEREERVVRALYGIGRKELTLAEAGRELGVSRERIRQIEWKAMRKLRTKQRGKPIAEAMPDDIALKETAGVDWLGRPMVINEWVRP